jgi:hypothetical protein
MTPTGHVVSDGDVLAADDAVLGHRCAVCEHDVVDHDAIGRRFCEATQAGALTRGCICASLVP